MVCVQYTASNTQPADSVAPVVSVSVPEKTSETSTTETVQVSVVFGSGSGTQPATMIKLDGAFYSGAAYTRVPNTTAIFKGIVIPKDGAAHTICVE